VPLQIERHLTISPSTYLNIGTSVGTSVVMLWALRPRVRPLGSSGVADLPSSNQDLEEAWPAAWTRFRDRVRGATAILFVTPEYNRSVPGALKNAIDVGSRPPAQSVWKKKPAAIVSASPGAIGGFGANHHLRQALVFSDMPTLQMPEAYIGGVDKLFDEAGELNAGTREFLGKVLAAFETLIARHAG